MTAPPPALFVAHATRARLDEDRDAARFLARLGADVPRPAAALLLSPLWCTDAPVLAADAAAGTGARIREHLEAAGFACTEQHGRSPDADAAAPFEPVGAEAGVPVLQLSIQAEEGPAWHHALGRALAPLREEGVLVAASGGLLGAGVAQGPGGGFRDWMAGWLSAGEVGALLDYRARAADAGGDRPDAVSLLPLFVALGAGGERARGVNLYQGRAHGRAGDGAGGPAVDVWAFRGARG